MEAYLDNSATTQCSQAAADLMMQLLRVDYGNPSSLHNRGMDAENYVKEARRKIAATLKVQEKEIYFTSGGTESNNLAIIGSAMANKRSGMHVITTAVEHPSVANPFAYLEEQGFSVTYLPVDTYGVVSLTDLKDAVCSDTILVSMMHVNNEIGAVEPIEEAARLIKQQNPNCLFHVDAIQSYGKFRIFPKRMGIDLMSVSGHKIHGPKGSGFLFVREKVKVKPIVLGGGQELGMRSGTENVPAIAGLAKAIEIVYSNLDREVEELYRIKEAFVEGVKQIPDVFVNGHSGRDGAPHVVSVSFQGVRSEVLLHALEDKGVYVSAGSACSAHKPQPSATLQAMGIDKELLGSTIRFSFSAFTTMDEISYTLQCLYDIIPVLRRFTRK